MFRALVLSLCLAAVPVWAQDAAPPDPAEPLENPYFGPAVSDVEWGVYCAQDPVRVEEAPGTAAGSINIVPDLPRIRYQQTVVPAEIGIAFGVLARVWPDSGIETVDVTVTHPPYPDSGITVERWQNIISDAELSLYGFSFEVPEELVTGSWTLRAEANGAVLFQVRFDVVPPDLAPHVIAACQGGFMS